MVSDLRLKREFANMQKICFNKIINLLGRSALNCFIFLKIEVKSKRNKYLGIHEMRGKDVIRLKKSAAHKW